MKMNYYGPGPYLEFEESGTVLSHGSDTIDCAAIQAPEQVVVDICMDAQGCLQFGIGGASVYVANLVIPAKKYEDRVLVDDEGEAVLNDSGSEHIERAAIDLDMEQVVGNLWTLPPSTNNSEGI